MEAGSIPLGESNHTLESVGHCFEKPWKVIGRKLSHFSAKRLISNMVGIPLGSAKRRFSPLYLLLIAFAARRTDASAGNAAAMVANENSPTGLRCFSR